MLAHARTEILKLSLRVSPEYQPDVGGWTHDVWEMTAPDVACAVDAYRSLLSPKVSDAVSDLIAKEGWDLSSMLLDERELTDGQTKNAHKTTRADLTELVAAATVIAAEGCGIDSMHMPNVPKMSRYKSDSGIDVACIELTAANRGELTTEERLVVVSVKHSIDARSASGIRGKLEASLGPQELTAVYLLQQLRVLNGRLRAEGVPHETAERVYCFVKGFPDSSKVELIGVAAIDPDLMASMSDQMKLLSPPNGGRAHLRVVLVPGLRTVHELCTQ